MSSGSNPSAAQLTARAQKLAVPRRTYETVLKSGSKTGLTRNEPCTIGDPTCHTPIGQLRGPGTPQRFPERSGARRLNIPERAPSPGTP